MNRSEWIAAYREARKAVKFWQAFADRLAAPPDILVSMPRAVRYCVFRWGDQLQFKPYRRPGKGYRSRVSGRRLRP